MDFIKKIFYKIVVGTMLLVPQLAIAASYSVANEAELRAAIDSINAAPGTTPAVTANTINISTAAITVTGTDLPVIRNGVTINSTVGGTTIDGVTAFRLFATFQASLSLNGISLTNGLARGGDGGAGTSYSGGGGGGLGAGGGAYVDLGQSLYLQNLSVSGCRATGGTGGAGGPTDGGLTIIGGGGGGASWTFGTSKNGGQSIGGGDFPGQSTNTTSTGGGVAYAGALTGYGGGDGGLGESVGTAGTGGGDGAAADVSGVSGGNGGYFGGGAGSGGLIAGGGGGNGGGKNTTVGTAGGGGGGGYGSGAAGGFAGPDAGGAGSGGGGGLGGGGGGGTGGAVNGGGGGGGFGAGGGGGGAINNPSGGMGGSFGGTGGTGTGSSGGGGGGGGAIGGGIFVGDSAFLYFGNNVTITPDANSLTIGAIGSGGSPAATVGSSLARDIFLFKAATLIFNGSSNQSVPTKIQAVASPAIADNGIDLQMTVPTAVITITSTANDYRGDTKVTTGILSVGGTNLPTNSAVNIGANGVLRLTATYTPAVTVTNSGAIEITSGTFTIPGTFNNTGALYVTGAGNIAGNIIAGSSLNIGRNSQGTAGAATLTRTNNNTTVTATNIYTGSSLVTSGTSTVTSNLYLLGNASFSGTGFSGSSLTTGRDSFSATPDATTAFAANQAISGYPTIAVVAGTFTNNNFAFTGVNTAFTIANGATATLNANFGGTATNASSNNSGTLNLNAGSFGLTSFNNNANGLITVNGGSINTNLTNNGTLNIAGTATLAVSRTITNNLTMNINATLNTNIGSNITNSATGILNLNATGSMGTSGTKSNAGVFNIRNTFSTSGFTNTGALYVVDNGSISGSSLSGGTLLHIGSDSTGTLGPNTFNSSVQINSIPIIRVFNGSTFTANSAVSGVTTSFTVDNGAAVTFNAALTGNGGAFTNSGTVTIGAAGSIGTTGAFVSSGLVNIAGTFTPSTFSSTNITSGLYLIGSGNISGALTGAAGSSLNIGQNSTGGANANDFTSSGTISIPTINVYAGSELNTTGANSISGVSGGMTIFPSGLASLGANYTGTGPVTNNSDLLILANYTAGLTTNNETMVLNGATINSAILNSNSLMVNGSSTNNSTITNNATFQIDAALANNGSIANNDDLVITQVISGAGTITNNANLVFDGSAENSNTISNTATGTLTSLDLINTGAITNENIFSLELMENNGSITNNASLTLSDNLSGTGTVLNSATGTFNFNAGTFNSNNITNNGIFNLANNVTNTGIITNNTSITIAATLLGAGTINNSNAATLTLATNTTNANAINNASGGNLNITGNNVTNTGAIGNSGAMSLTGSLSGAGVVTNNATGTLTFSGGTSSNASAITNNGIFNVTGASTNSATISNNNAMTISNTLAGAGIINNGGSATLQLAANSVVSNTINNSSGGIINVAAVSSVAEINNAGTLNISQPLTATGDINNTGLVNMQRSINMPGFTLTNNNTIAISGSQTLTALDFISDGALNFTITDQSTYDSLVADCDIDISNGDVNVSSSFFGSIGSIFTWDILEGTAITTNGSTAINLPGSSNLGTWSSDIISGSILRVTLSRIGTPFVPPAGVDTEIAQVLDNMSQNVTNAGQSALLSAVNSADTQAEYDYILDNLQPNTNTSSVTIAMQNIGFNKIEVRAGQKKRKTDKQRRLASLNDSGIATGDLNHDYAMWLAGFGSLSKQRTEGENQGYRAKILGGMLGFDTQTANDNVYGIAFGVSNANVYALFNTTNTTRILAYNLMFYGANNFAHDYFAEWILSGTATKNHGTRVFGINGRDLSTEAGYRNNLAGLRINFGKLFDLTDTFSLSQVNLVQYVLVHQPSYNETGSVAALHVSTSDNQSILTLGTGFRVGILNDNSWLHGNRELRAMVTYDAISPEQATTANFVVGSDDFTLTSSPERLALKLGVDCGFMIYKKLNLQLSYNYELRSGYYDNFGEIKLKYFFN